MKQNRNLFVCEHMGWTVRQPGGDEIILEYEAGHLNSYFDRDKENEEIVFRIKTKEADLIQGVNAAYREFNPSLYIEEKILNWQESYSSPSPAMTYADAAKKIFSMLEKLKIALDENSRLDSFEEKTAAAAKKNGFDFFIKRGRERDTFWFQKYGDERIVANVWKNYDEDIEEILTAPDKERLNDLTGDLLQDIEMAQQRSSSRGLSEEGRRNAAMIAKDGTKLISDLKEMI